METGVDSHREETCLLLTTETKWMGGQGEERVRFGIRSGTKDKSGCQSVRMSVNRVKTRRKSTQNNRKKFI